MRSSRAYVVWYNMMQRCHNPDHPNYERYGERGIRVCQHWHTFDNFLADMGKPPPRKSIERRNNDGDYTKENCCWATRREQQNNRRNSITLTFEGKTQPLTHWADELSISRTTLYMRHVRGDTGSRLFRPERNRA